jgi:hypothetical protein
LQGRWSKTYALSPIAEWIQPIGQIDALVTPPTEDTMDRIAESTPDTTAFPPHAPGDTEAARRHLQAARVTLRELGSLASVAGSSLSGATVGAEVTRVLIELEGFDSETPAVSRVPCDFCGRLIMPAATLCGFCWHARAGRTPREDHAATAAAVSQL